MCIECDFNRIYGVYLCIEDRKVWKGGNSCPTCGERGKHMGWRWRAPRLTDKNAWRRIEQGDYLWELPKHFIGQPTWSGDKLNLAKPKPKGLGR